ncbi:Transcription factor A, mitochondrial [Frankliniella fusca]|uniref:Transcription factor A, mitochondrial n=1 Tax=Frankliniella fusca TaxID=407009 RepID=A0AAE1HXC4_9NEOP|nr:Transcription factor A, mitochondrial [Frankliniella fusca]
MSDEALLKLLQRFGKPVTTPSKINIKTIHEDLRHVKTWKRSLYLQVPKDAPPCPEVMHIIGLMHQWRRWSAAAILVHLVARFPAGEVSTAVSEVHDVTCCPASPWRSN